MNLIYLWLGHADLAVKRVEQRVAQGGHHIPEETIRRRYTTGLKNVLKCYLPLADNALIIDNSITESQTVVARKDLKNGLKIENFKIWEQMQGVTDG